MHYICCNIIMNIPRVDFSFVTADLLAVPGLEQSCQRWWVDKMHHRLWAGVHGINRLGFLIHREASYSSIPDVAASGFNMVQVPACLSAIVHQPTSSLSYLSLGICCRHPYNSLMLRSHTPFFYSIEFSSRCVYEWIAKDRNFTFNVIFIVI